MSGQKAVLIAVDGSVHSERAFDWYVTNLYRDGDEVIGLVCPQIANRLSSIAEEDKTPEGIKGIIEDENKRIQETMDRFTKRIETTQVKGEVTTVNGISPGQTIVEMAESRGVSFIVIGSRGQGVKRRTPIGQVCDFVMNHATVPVMICKDA
ncbi:universal stress protein YxiE-like [Haliotis cracherodii]|uniref:universal stress protein YxiE-like n=1 Tax=Haliotis cracherodii TaxID=6455 RepID=UPI0039E92728